MAVGRPKEHDRKEIAAAMIEWAKKDDSTNLCGFCCEVEINANSLLRWKDEDEEFRGTYELVKQFLGNRREKMLSDGKLHVKAYDLNAKTYDRFLKEEHKEESKYQSDLRKGEDESRLNAAQVLEAGENGELTQK